MSSPHEVSWVEVVSGDVWIVVSIGGALGMVGFLVPLGCLIDVLFVRPCATCAASGFVFWTVPVHLIDSVVGRRCFIDNLQFQVKGGRLAVENVHSSVGNGHVDVTGSFTNNAEEVVRRTDFKR